VRDGARVKFAASSEVRRCSAGESHLIEASLARNQRVVLLFARASPPSESVLRTPR